MTRIDRGTMNQHGMAATPVLDLDPVLDKERGSLMIGSHSSSDCRRIGVCLPDLLVCFAVIVVWQAAISDQHVDNALHGNDPVHLAQSPGRQVRQAARDKKAPPHRAVASP